MYSRVINLSKSHSYFLFGPRATGKTTLLKSFFNNLGENHLWIDLLDPETEKELSLYPSRLIERILVKKDKKPSWVVIDEIQKIPKLLDVVHKLIFEEKINFALTESSARKLKRGNANLLAGRAFSFKLHPLSFIELEDEFNLDFVFRFGHLPAIYSLNNDQDRKRYLMAYVQNYIKEEILIEQIIRNIEPFRAFLEVAAQSNTEILNYSKLAREACINPKSVERFFEILEDTLLGFMLQPYSRSIRKRQLQKPKFYFFDIGVVRALTNSLDSPQLPKTYGYGKTFEQMIILEFFKLNDYFEKGFKFSFLRTKDGVEIDLVIEKNNNIIFVEIKSKDSIIEDDLRHIRKISQELNSSNYILCQEKYPRKVENINIFPWKEGILEIFNS